jgi:hypothetical protein
MPVSPISALFRYDGPAGLAASLRAALLPDWDRNMPELERYIPLCGHIPFLRRRLLVRTLKARAASQPVLLEKRGLETLPPSAAPSTSLQLVGK